jgi:hypothetical protein
MVPCTALRSARPNAALTVDHIALVTSDLRKASAQSDIYSLGCIIHEMIGTDARVPCHEIREQGGYGAILRSCTRADPLRRFRSVRSVLDALVSVTTELLPIVATKSAEFGNQLSPARHWTSNPGGRLLILLRTMKEVMTQEPCFDSCAWIKSQIFAQNPWNSAIG